MKTLKEILKEKEFREEDFFFYGNDIAKVLNDIPVNNKGNLVLVTSTSPTKYGEGKTTLAISLNDALNSLGKSSVVVLREPSLGPVFGVKGGATGGGKAKVLPEEEINLHFTGDIHAVTTANNLLSAIIDNSIYQGNNLGIKEVVHERCIDLNDRSLRCVKTVNGDVHFNISTASEVMAILCLAKDKDDLKKRLGNILVGFDNQNKPVYAKDLDCVNALYILLKNALKPNVVKTLEENIALVHGGPFANIAHGTNSVLSSFYAMNNFSYTILEAGFGSDMGGVKFFDLVTRLYPSLKPSVVVINTTIKSLVYNGEGVLSKGIENLEYHIKNMAYYTNKIIVCLNVHEDDVKEDIDYLESYVKKLGITFTMSKGYLEGSKGSIDLANKVMDMVSIKDKEFKYVYDLNDKIKDKIAKFCKNTFGAKEVKYSDKALEKLDMIDNSDFSKLPICIAKTQYSITDNPHILGYPKDFVMTVSDIKVFNGAGFIVVYFGSIMTMPGLTKEANYLTMGEEL